MINVALLCGGDSSEREISLKSARAMHGALDTQRFNVRLYDVSQVQSNSTVLALDESRLAADEVTALRDWWQTANGQHVAWPDLTSQLKAGDMAVVLSSLHGGWGEDGTVQTLLQIAEIPFAGSPARASMIAMDKRLCKALVRESGVLAPRGVVVSSPDAPMFDGACVVKPNGGGSSMGVSFLREFDEMQWRTAIESALSDGSDALVEELVEGVEVTAAVMGEGESAQALPIVEVVPQDATFYDYKAKYAAGGSEHICPARLDEATTQRIQRDALAVYRALGCRGVARADFLVKADGTPVFLEINTLPGMTQTSLVPDAARAAGISFSSLVENLVLGALQ
ncbi:MAG TPA: D-alanine--D-alanine ligase [Abditibacteriaceae bacterium]|jgi:D-alanine-D-alanine ligase